VALPGQPRGDGRLTHELDPHDRGPQDACGVFGVWAPGEEVAKLAYYGIYALQHRGQESAGIAVSNGRQILVYKDMGLVSQVFDESTLSSLKGHLAIGHARYSTTGASTWHNAQPTFRPTAHGSIALGHNGNLTNTSDLARMVAELPSDTGELEIHARALETSTNDTSLVTALLAYHPDQSLEDRAAELLPQVRGAFSFVWMDEGTLYAARDPQGVRPLVLGRLERGWVVASETAALDIVGASYVREIEPGELIAVDEDGLRTRRFAEPAPKGCLFEFVYLARPDTRISNQRVHSVRVEIGRRLAQDFPADADLVIPVPESGTPAAIGYAEESGIPYGVGLVKNSYVGRTFIQPSQTIRQLGIRLKLNPLRDVIEGKRLVVVDDSIVRGNTRPGPDAARGRSPRGARQDLEPAGEVAVLLRHRLRDPGRADRQRTVHRGHLCLDRRRLARLHLPGEPRRSDHGALGQSVPRLLRRGVPDRAARARTSRQAPARGRDPGARPRAGRRRPGCLALRRGRDRRP
jgi:amidophosphoribosyltransferase